MDGLLFLLLLGVLAIALSVAVLALASRVIFKMAARNFARRKAQSAIVVAGLMIGTAIISASLVVGDTMRYIFVNQTYHDLGETDEQIFGTSQFGTSTWFSENVYVSMRENLSKVEGIQAVVPAITESVSVMNARENLSEPSVTLAAYDSAIMRATVFGDLDGKGLYTDRLGPNELFLNTLTADALEARTGDTLQVSFGVRNATNPLVSDMVRQNFTVAGIIQQGDLYGKANFGGVKPLFMELSRAQELLGRPGQINRILISNAGDTWGGEGWTGKVNGSIRKALDDAVGMDEMGLTLTLADGLELNSRSGYFSSEYSGIMLGQARNSGAKSMTGTVISTLALNGAPTMGLLAIGFNTTDPAYPPVNEGTLYVFQGPAAMFNLTNGTSVALSGMGFDGRPHSAGLTASVLPTGFEMTLPPELQGVSLGFIGPATARQLLSGGAFEGELLSFARVYGVDNSTAATIASQTRSALDARITAKDANLKVVDSKYDSLKSARTSGSSIGDIFMIFSVFSIIAGVVLIVNIFVMLAEERKSEMGMSRAVGMKRKHLIRMFLFEGTIYVFISSAVGAFLGLAFGWLLILAFGFIFGDGGADFPFYFTWDSLLTAFCLGTLLTFVSIFFASRRSARLNIIRAIRRIPEPRGSRAGRSDVLIGAAILAFGVLFWLVGIGNKSALGWMVGPSLVILGAAAVAHKWVSIRAAMTPASLLIIFWMFKPTWMALPGESEAASSGGGLELFIASGLILVLAGVLLVMFNSEVLLNALQRTVGSHRSTRAVLKTAISYPMEHKFKTGMTLTMFSLIVFTVTVIAMIASMQASTMENERIRQSGGYDIIGFSNPGTPFVNVTLQNIPAFRENRTYDIRQMETLSAAYVNIRHYDSKGAGTGSGTGPAISTTQNINVLLGVSDSFMENNSFPLQDRDKNYSSDRACWQALKGNDSLCIIDGTKLQAGGVFAGPQFGETPGAYVGGSVTITDLAGQNRTRTFRVIGIMYQQYFFQGVITNKRLVQSEYGGADLYLLVDLAPGQNVDLATRDFKAAYANNGMQAIDITAILDFITTAVSDVMYLMEGFLAIGLLIGIAGIGIISYRNVIERRQQIGMMRAIGFRRQNITTSFLIETSFVTIIAIVMGIVFGIGIGWQIYDGGGYKDLGASFAVPWGNLLIITVGAYIATLLFTFYPSLMAARIAPADALRYIE
jgi:putative ABC transport system permease protein